MSKKGLYSFFRKEDKRIMNNMIKTKEMNTKNIQTKEVLPDGTVFYKPLADGVFKAMFVGRKNLLKFYLDMSMEEEVNVINSNILELPYKSVWSKKQRVDNLKIKNKFILVKRLKKGRLPLTPSQSQI